jgi:hypothetical protein
MALGMLALAACGHTASTAPEAADPGAQPAGDSAAATVPVTGGIVADSGFRPDDHGFVFENYGDRLRDGSTPTNMTAADMRLMFGDGVCADAAVGRCDLVPGAQKWLDATNTDMNGGHCYGFSVAAQLLWEGRNDATSFGAPQTPGLAIARNVILQRSIASDWAMQLLDSVRSKEITGSPNKVLDALRAALHPNPAETYTIAIFKPDWSGGHAVTPYAVVDRGGGIFDVLIYDNNWPGTTRAIVFDTNANTWTYDAATNPDQPDEVYKGTAKTKTISLFPTSPGLGAQKCPFCKKRPRSTGASAAVGTVNSTVPAGSPSEDLEEIVLTGSDVEHADLLITDGNGHRLGVVNGKVVQEMPGGSFDPLVANRDWSESMSPAYFVPAGQSYTITIDGSGLSSPDMESLDVVGPDFDVAVDDIPMSPHETDNLAIAPDGTTLSYSSSRFESPTIEVGASDDDADYAYVVAGVSDRPDSTITLDLPIDAGKLSLTTTGTTGSSKVDVQVARTSAQGDIAVRHDRFTLTGGATHVV